jgi:hypothetical protein
VAHNPLTTPAPVAHNLSATPAPVAIPVPVASLPTAAQPPPPTAPEVKTCPFCGESILGVALKCKHCGETVDVALRTAEEASRLAKRQSQPVVFMNAGGGGASSSSSSSSSAAAAAAGTDYVRQRYVPPFPHALYFALTLFTCGLGLTIWWLHCTCDSRPSGGEKFIVTVLWCAYCGAALLAVTFFCLSMSAPVK